MPDEYFHQTGTGPSRSHADFWWCKLAAQRKFSVEEIAAELPKVTEKAREKIRVGDPGYVTKTAENGAAGAEQGKQRGRAHSPRRVSATASCPA